MATDRVKLIRTAIDIVVLHVCAADCRGLQFQSLHLRATHGLWDINHLVALKALPNQVVLSLRHPLCFSFA